MNKKTPIEFKVMDVAYRSAKENSYDFIGIETIKAKDIYGQDITMTRFVKKEIRGYDQYCVKVGVIYKGTLDPKDPDYDFPVVHHLKAYDKFNGDMVSDEEGFDIPPDPVQEQLKTEAMYKSWGAMHMAAPIVASVNPPLRIRDYSSNNKSGFNLVEVKDELKNLLIEVAKICTEAHEEYSEQLYKELKAKNGKGGE